MSQVVSEKSFMKKKKNVWLLIKSIYRREQIAKREDVLQRRGKIPLPDSTLPCPPLSYTAAFRCRQPEQFTWSWSKRNMPVLSLTCFICSCKYSLKESESIVTGWKYLEVPRQWSTTCAWPCCSCSILQNSAWGVCCLPGAKTCCGRDDIMAGAVP